MKSESKAIAKTPPLRVIDGGKPTIRIPALSNVKQPEEHLTADRVEPEDVNWLWWPRIAAGTITIVGAKGGTGKGMFLTDLAARITTGALWPTKAHERAPRGRVLWCETEDLISQTVIPRMIAARTDRSKVILKKSASELFQIKDLRGYIETGDIKLIVLSPLNAFLEGVEDGNSGQKVRRGLEDLQAHIEGTGCAIVGICHLNKKTDLDAVDRLLGSVEYVNFVRNVLLLNSEDEFTVRVVHAKQNISSKGRDLLFTKVNRRPGDKRSAYWSVDNWMVADENVNQDRMYERKSDDDSEHTKSAAEWLRNHLADGNWHNFDDVVTAAENYSHTKSALQKAQQRSRGQIESNRTGFPPDQVTFWRLK